MRKAKAFLSILFVLLIASSASAFVIEATAPQKEIEGEMYYALDSETSKSSTISLDGASIEIPARDYFLSLGSDFSELFGNFTVTLEKIEPTVFNKNGTCSQRCCQGGTGPKANFSVVDTMGLGNFTTNRHKAVHQDFSTCTDKRGDLFEKTHPDRAVFKIKIKSIQAPEYIGKEINGRTYYVMKEGSEPNIRVEFRMSFFPDAITGPGWTEFLSSLEEFPAMASTDGGSDSSGETPSTQTASQIWERVQSNSETVAGQADDSVAGTQTSQGQISGGISDDAIARCTAELNETTRAALIAKTRFEYGRGIGYPPGATGWNEFVTDEIEKAIPVSWGGYSLTLQKYYPPAADEGKEQKFNILGEHSGTVMNCYAGTSKAGYRKLNEVQNCDYQGQQEFLKFKVYKGEGPHFENSLLTEGLHCYDVWAFLALKFKMEKMQGEGTGYLNKHTWWIDSMQELENYNQYKSTGNLTVSVLAEEDNEPVPNATVTIRATVDGETYSDQKTANARGTAKFIAPIGVPVTVTAEKESYKENSSTVTIDATGSAEVLLDRDYYNMRFAYSRADFWKLYYEVAPYFMSDTVSPVDATDPAFLKSNVPDTSDYAYLYSAVPLFLKVQAVPCDQAGTEIEFEISQRYAGETIAGYGGYDVKLDYIIIFKEMAFGGQYFACYNWPLGEDKFKTVEVPWSIDQRGVLTEQAMREIP